MQTSRWRCRRLQLILPAVITLDSGIFYTYDVNSVFTNTYTDFGGTEPVNPIHRSGNDDRWIQYRVFLITTNGTLTPAFLENRIGYLTANGVYKPDGAVEGNGDDLYGGFGSGAGGASEKESDPGFNLTQPLTYNIQIQNDGTPASLDDTYVVSWNTPSDVSGNWTAYLVTASDLLPRFHKYQCRFPECLYRRLPQPLRAGRGGKGYHP